MRHTRWTDPHPPVDKACAILKVSHFLVVEAGISYARHHLDNNVALSPFQRLKLGFDYRFGDWIAKAFDELMAIPINDIAEEDEYLMGAIAYRALTKTQASVLDARLNLALVNIPDVNHCNWCSNHAYCQLEWIKMWTSTAGVLGALLKEELSGAEILEKLPTYDRGGMSSDCHRRTCDGLRDTEDKVSVLREEEGLIDGAIQELLNMARIPSSK